MRINKHDTNGTKGLLAKGELGYDDYSAGGDTGRVFVGTGTENISLAKKAEVSAVDSTTVKLTGDQTIAGVKTFSSNIVGNITGNAASATKLATTRLLGGVSFDGTANINLPGVNIAGNQSTTGNAATATKLQTARTIALSGDVTGTVNFDGTGNVNIATTIAPNSVLLGTDTTGNYVAGNTAGTGISITGTAGEGWSPTIALTNVGTAGTYRSVTTDAQGRVTAGTNPTTVSGYGLTDVYTKTEVDAKDATKQNTLVSGTSIKTVNGTSILGSGDIEINSSSTLSELTDVDITTLTPYIGNALIWSGSKWVPSNSILEPKLPIQYGLQWNNAADTYTRLGAAVGWTTGADFSSNETAQSLMRRCVLNANGTVNYYLSATDSTKKADGVTAADLTGTSGNVMVEIPKFWVKYDNTTGAKEMWISTVPSPGYVVHPAFVKNGVEVDYRYYRAYTGSVSGTKLISRSGVAATGMETIAAFRTKAQANGTGWGLVDWHLLFAVQTLLFIEIGTLNSQSVLGNGNDTGNDYGMTTGGSNSIGNASSPATNDNTWMSYRGIENFYADISEWIDGINISTKLVYTSNTQSTFESGVFSGAYTSTEVTLPSSGYISDMNFSTKGFIPTVSTGSDSTYVTDYVTSSSFPTSARVAAFGGSAGLIGLAGLHAGAACLNMNTSALAIAPTSIGAGLSF